jgi:CHAT domain-containing protein
MLEEQLLAFLISDDRFEMVELEASAEELTNLVEGFRDVMALRRPEAVRQRAQSLYEFLIGSLTPALKTPRLAIIPHGPLHYLPFTALLDPGSGRYLLEDYDIITLPSGSAIPFIQKNAGKPLTSPLVLGNPKTDHAALAPLAAAEQEAQKIAALFGQPSLVGDAATETAIRQQIGQAGILHLAAHGGYNLENPLYSTLYLAPDRTRRRQGDLLRNQKPNSLGDTLGAVSQAPAVAESEVQVFELDPIQDGRLEVYEVYGLDLKQTELVVLSACQTQLGRLSAGDEVVGLTRAFMFAGTPTVVASLWNVDDAATALLMERFYTHLKAGLGKSAALRQAQLDLLQHELYREPYYWSAFVLSGDGGEITEIPAALSASGGGDTAQTIEVRQADLSKIPMGSRILIISGALLGLVGLFIVAGAVFLWLRRPGKLGEPHP